jgi:UDP-2-acetamido-3-amino-2,3-dideoxy-glucuronate N-acetyltransferase
MNPTPCSRGLQPAPVEPRSRGLQSASSEPRSRGLQSASSEPSSGLQSASPPPSPDHYRRVAPDVRLGQNVKLSGFVNLYGCEIGDDVKIGAFVEIQKGAKIGSRCKISSHSFICEGVTIEDEVFVGHGVIFINDRYPRSTAADGRLQTEADWHCDQTRIERGASLGSGATIMGGLTIGAGAMVGAGSVVTRDVPARSVVAGNPARFVRRLEPEAVTTKDTKDTKRGRVHHGDTENTEPEL